MKREDIEVGEIYRYGNGLVTILAVDATVGTIAPVRGAMTLKVSRAIQAVRCNEDGTIATFTLRGTEYAEKPFAVTNVRALRRWKR